MKNFLKLSFAVIAAFMVAITGSAQTVTTYTTTATQAVGSGVASVGFQGTNLLSATRYVHQIQITGAGGSASWAVFDSSTNYVISTNTYKVAAIAITAAATTGGTPSTSTPFGANPVDQGIERTQSTTYSSTAVGVVKPILASGIAAASTVYTYVFNPPIQVSGIAITNSAPSSGSLTYSVTHSTAP